LSQTEPNFDFTSEEAVEALKLIKTFESINLVKLFEKLISFQMPEILIKKIFQLAEDSRAIIQQLNSEQKSFLTDSLKVKFNCVKIVFSGKSGRQIKKALFKVTNLLYQNQYLVLKSPCGLPQDGNF
jgi:hypothetical protein